MDNNAIIEYGGECYDCIVVGGGVIGCAAARSLCAFSGRYLLLESGNDVAVGTTKANSGIVHAGYDALPGTVKARVNVRGAALMANLCRELEVPYKVNGALVISFDGRQKLAELKARGDANGAVTELITGGEAKNLEPKLADGVTDALYAPTSALVSPYELAIALYENYIANGGRAVFGCRVRSVRRAVLAGRGGERGYVVTADDGTVYGARAVINAAGLNADIISNTVCSKQYSLRARRGQYMLLDKTALPVSHTIFGLPTALGKGVLVAPTCHGNTIVGPSAEDIGDREDVATTAAALDDVFAQAQGSVPSLAKRDIITQFAGNRAVSGGDFVIGETEERFFNALGICSPGLASSPAIGVELAEGVAARLGLDCNKNFERHRAAIPCFASASDAERDALIAADCRYGRVVCRCETVTEGEVVEAIRRGAVDLDGIKRRVRAGMGRCQAGFCTPRLIAILARERGIPADFVTKRGRGSELIG